MCSYIQKVIFTDMIMFFFFNLIVGFEVCVGKGIRSKMIIPTTIGSSVNSYGVNLTQATPLAH